METPFILKHEELNSNFLATLKKLFKDSPQIQISVSSTEDFDLLQTETAQQYMERLTRCLADIQTPKNAIAFSENELDQIILEKL